MLISILVEIFQIDIKFCKPSDKYLIIVLQQSLNKSLSFRDGPTGGTSFVNIHQNVRLDPLFKKINVDKLTF